MGKLCDGRGPTYEWVSSKLPRLTKQGKTHLCQIETFVTVVVPGLSRSSSTSPSQESSTPIHHQVQLRSEVTSSHQEIGRRIPQGIHRNRMTVCEIFHNGWRISQKKRRTKVASRKHSILSSLPKAPKLRNLLLFAEDALAKQYFEQQSVVTC